MTRRKRARTYRVYGARKRPFTFEAQKDHIVCTVSIDNDEGVVVIRFDSVDQMLGFFTAGMEEAAKVWPDNPLVEYYSDNTD